MNSPPDSLFPDTVLITGADGTLGRGLLRAGLTADDRLWSTTRRRHEVSPRTLLLDLAQPQALWTLPPVPADVAFLCAGTSSQEQCASAPVASSMINVANTVQLARRLAADGTFVIFISTSLVFDGQTPAVKAEAAPNPQTAYGRQKADAERELLQLGKRCAIVRLSKVIAPAMPLFERWKNELHAGRVIHPYSDLPMAPISLRFAIDLLRRVAAQRSPGIIQASASRDMTYAQAAMLIARQLGVDPSLIAPASQPALAQACSPRYTTLDDTALRSIGLSAPLPEEAFGFAAPVANEGQLAALQVPYRD